MRYLYGMRLRGFSIGCQPKDGLIGREDMDDRRYHDVLAYDRRLTEKELEDYELDYIGVAGGDALCVYVARDDAGLTDEALERLQKVIDSKKELLKKAFGAESLDLDITSEKVGFHWFVIHEESGEVYSRFVDHLVRFARDAKRVTARERKIEGSAKYAFRCFLLRLGYIGKEYKEERAILLRNFSGSSARKEEKK